MIVQPRSCPHSAHIPAGAYGALCDTAYARGAIRLDGRNVLEGGALIARTERRR